jgi:putative oxidoreductase
MDIKKCFRVRDFDCGASWALLFLRLVMGVAFTLHGWGKIQTPFSWMPAGAPVSIPGIFQFLAAFSEFGGGIALVLGLVFPLASLGMVFTMGVATFVHAVIFKDPFVASGIGSSFEPALTYFSVALVLMTVGPGKYSLDYKIFGKK